MDPSHSPDRRESQPHHYNHHRYLQNLAMGRLLVIWLQRTSIRPITRLSCLCPGVLKDFPYIGRAGLAPGFEGKFWVTANTFPQRAVAFYGCSSVNISRWRTPFSLGSLPTRVPPPESLLRLDRMVSGFLWDFLLCPSERLGRSLIIPHSVAYRNTHIHLFASSFLQFTRTYNPSWKLYTLPASQTLV